MNIPGDIFFQERDSGSSSLKTVSEVSSEDIQPTKNSPSKYNDAEPSKSAVNSRLVPIIPATDFVDISSSSESESDDGIQVVEHHETRQVRYLFINFFVTKSGSFLSCTNFQKCK